MRKLEAMQKHSLKCSLNRKTMLLKEALEIHKKAKGKTDILELANIEVKTNFLEEKYYQDKINSLPKGKQYFISDLDGTFFR